VTDPAHPLLRIVRGLPDDVDPSVEVAALAAVLTTRGSGAAAEPATPDVWSSPERSLRAPVFPSRDGWQNSARPR
jgi:hypothetical protein